MQRQKISRGAHSVHQLYAHLVFVTFWRRRLITAQRKQRLESLFRDICSKKGAELVTFGSDHDDNEGKPASDKPVSDKPEADNHVHLLVRYPPTISISELVQQLKGESSYRISLDEREGRLENGERASRFQWSSAYFAKSVGHTSSAGTHKYIAGQGTRRNRKKRR